MFLNTYRRIPSHHPARVSLHVLGELLLKAPEFSEKRLEGATPDGGPMVGPRATFCPFLTDVLFVREHGDGGTLLHSQEYLLTNG